MDDKSKVVVTGGSDDIISVKGQVCEEFYVNCEEEHVLAFSDGTLLHVEYDKDGIWRIKGLVKGVSAMEKEEGDVSLDTNDIVVLSGGDIAWVVVGRQWEIGSKK